MSVESGKKMNAKKNEVRAGVFAFACWSLIFHWPDRACRLDPAWLYTKLIPAASFYLLLQYAACSWTFLHYLSFYSQERETFEKPCEITHRPSSPVMALYAQSYKTTDAHICHYTVPTCFSPLALPFSLIVCYYQDFIIYHRPLVHN